MNTRRLNRRAQAVKAQGATAKHSRRTRAPPHGLLGDAHSQRDSVRPGATPTISLRQSQATALQKKGRVAALREVVASAPDIFVDETSFIPRSPSPAFQDSEPPATWDDGTWEDSDSEASPASDEMSSAIRAAKVEYRDFRTRRDRTNLKNTHWAEQVDEMVGAFMDWSLHSDEAMAGAELGDSLMWIDVVDIFGTKQQAIPHTEHCWQSSSLVRAGIIPTSPLRHTAGVTIRTISLYHKLFVRCPRLGIQPFAKALCDIQGKAFKPYLSTQLYEALDVYVAILNGVRTRTREALSRQGREWRMLNACPCCQFRLKEDSNLRVWMIVSMDENDSLKRVERKEDVLQEQEQGENGQGLPPVLKERIDGRVGGAAYFASRRETNAWDEKNWGGDCRAVT
ncbi:hypothetical protein LENED_009735 [Lentinula edodes]|uniref:Uncharacterized protein n=1 Tax=Lentinula edodes TaxID=5353 RepID=A0A1Q3EKT4_LENED|nr:hypothetical protein LENED_009735 [Lentinula edodes]